MIRMEFPLLEACLPLYLFVDVDNDNDKVYSQI